MVICTYLSQNGELKTMRPPGAHLFEQLVHLAERGGRERLHAAHPLHVAPQPGAHELKLVGEDGRAVAAARFEVRGAPR